MIDWQTDPELASAAEAIAKGGWTAEDCAAKVTTIDVLGVGLEPIKAFKESLERTGTHFENDSFERVLLLHTAARNWSKAESLRVHPKVKQLLLEDLKGFAKRKKGSGPALGTSVFEAYAKMASLRRFPTGPMDWEVSGLPRSWVARGGLVESAKFAWFLASKFGGFKPLFFMHVGIPPRNRTLVIEKEVQRSYYRMADSLRAWPESRGILAYGWFYDPVAVQDNPHLKFLNQPFLECGGVFRQQVADPDSGFAINNPERLRQYEAGELRYYMYAALWPRAAALAWVDQHPEFNG